MTTINNQVSQNTFGLNRFQLLIPRCPMLSFLSQQVTIPEQMVQEGQTITRDREITLPGERMEYSDLVITANLDEYWLAYEEVNAWQNGITHPYNDVDWGDILSHFQTVGVPEWIISSVPDFTRSKSEFMNSFSTAEIILKTSHNTSFARLEIEYIWPKSITHQDLQTQGTDGMEPNAFSVTFAAHDVRFKRLKYPWD